MHSKIYLGYLNCTKSQSAAYSVLCSDLDRGLRFLEAAARGRLSLAQQLLLPSLSHSPPSYKG